MYNISLHLDLSFAPPSCGHPRLAMKSAAPATVWPQLPAPWLWRTKSWRPSVRGMDGHGKLRVGHDDVFEQFTRSCEG